MKTRDLDAVILSILSDIHSGKTLEERKASSWDMLTTWSKAFLKDEDFLHDPEGFRLVLEMIQMINKDIHNED